MGILDTVIILFTFVLIVIGFIKGFTKQFLSSCAWIVGLIAASSLSGYLGNLIDQSSFGIAINDKFVNWFSEKGEAFTTVLPTLTEENLSAALTDLNIPSIFHSIIISQLNINGFENMSIVEYICPVITSFITTSISYVLIYLVVFLFVKLLSKIFGGFVKGSALGFLDSVLGVVWAVVKSFIIVSVSVFILSIVSSFPFAEALNNWIETDINTTTEGYRIAKFFYENNPILKLLEFIEFKL